MSGSTQFTDLAQAVIAAYKGRDNSFSNRLQYWIDYFGQRDISTIASEDVEDGIDALIKRGKSQVKTCRSVDSPSTVVAKIISTGKPLAPSTVNRYVASLASMYKELRRSRLLPRGLQIPTRGVTRQTEGPGRTLTITVTEVLHLVAICRISRNRKLAALVAFACTTGWRLGTIQKLKWSEIDLLNGTADTGRTKNGTPHRAVLLPWVIEEIQKIQPRNFDVNGLIFGPSSIKRAWKNALKRADLPQEWTIHHCRHIAASILAQGGASVPVIMACLNHKTPQMALRYSHLNTRTLRDNLNKAWSKTPY